MARVLRASHDGGFRAAGGESSVLGTGVPLVAADIHCCLAALLIALGGVHCFPLRLDGVSGGSGGIGFGFDEPCAGTGRVLGEAFARGSPAAFAAATCSCRSGA